jgi:hypothetical protein
MTSQSGKSNFEFSLLHTQSSSFALSFSSRDRVIYVYAKLGFVGSRPVFYFDIKDFVTLERNDKLKPEIDEVALRKAVIKKAGEHFETFYLRTDEPDDFLITSPVDTMGIREDAQTVCLPLAEKIIPMEDYFESVNHHSA